MLDHMKTVLGLFLEHALAPAVARTGEIDEVVKGLKQSLVRHIVDQSAAPKDTLARHFGKSDRWLYRQLEDYEASRKERLLPHEGHRLMVEVVQFFQRRLPARGTPTECARQLRQGGWKISTAELEPLLSLYAGMGYLERREPRAGEDEPSYRAASRVSTVKAAGEQERLQWLARHVGDVFPIAVSYLRGDDVARFAVSEGELLENHLKAAARDIWQYQVTRLNQAIEASLQDDPDERIPRVHYRAMFLCGVGPFFDDAKGGER